MKVTPPDVPTPGMAGGEKANACASGKPASCSFSPRMMTSAVAPCLVALVPRLQGDEVEGAVGGVDDAQQAEADDTCCSI